MSRKNTFIFVCLCLFPFVLAMGFRAADNYQFAQHKKMLHKTHPSYLPKEPPKANEWLIEKDFTCYKKKGLNFNNTEEQSSDDMLTGMD